MPTSLLSSLSRGYGTWTGAVDTALPSDDSLPSLDANTCPHRHGVTVTPRANTAPTFVPVANDGHLDIPKTFLTRKGALMLFASPDSIPEEPTKTPRVKRKRPHQKDVIDLSLKLRTIERLSMSVLQFGDKSYDKESASVTDKDSQSVFNFIHDINQENDDCDLHSQPGGDLKFYLRDLKRRASCRGYGGPDSSPYRARSAELQEILDQLEDAWPHYASSSSYRRESMFTGSVASGEDFFYPSSPTPSNYTARSFSSIKVLSSKKLTASLKSVNYMGRPVSTEPETTGLLNENLRASPEYLYGRSKSARSGVWISEKSSPAQPDTRPKTSPHSGRAGSGKARVDRKLLTSPEHTEDEAASEDGGQAVWVDVDGQGDVSYISDDLQSQVSGTSERGRGEKSGDRDGMLVEAASVLSSLIEEEDIDVPIDDLTDEGDIVDSQWPDAGQQGRKSGLSVRSRSRGSQKNFSDGRRSADIDDGLTHPLQPPYSGVMMKDDDRKSPMEGEEGEDDAHLQMLQQDSRPGSRSVSRAGTQVGSRPVSALAADRVPSRASSGTPVPLSRGETPAGFAGHSEQMIDQVTEMMSDAERLQASSALGAASVSSADKPAADPDTLVSLHKDEVDFEKKKEKEKAKQLELLLSATTKKDKVTEPATSAVTDIKPQKVSDPKPTLVTKETATLEPVTPRTEEALSGDEAQVATPRTPRRRPKKETETPRKEEEESPGKEDGDEGKPPELSERVKKEKEEKQKKAEMLKEEKEKAEAAKREEEEKKKQEAEDKRNAAAERLRQKAEEAAQRKEEERKKKEEEAILGLVTDAASKPTSAAGKKGGKAGKAGKVGKKGAKAGKDEDKQFVNALDITSVQPGEGGAVPKGLDALEKLKEANAGGDLPMDKLKEFVAAQAPKPVIVPEKKKEEVPEHIKEMFERKTEAQAQEELDEEMLKMQSAVDSALGGSVLQTEGTEGLSAEDFALAQEALMERIKKAQEEISDKPPAKADTKSPAKPATKQQTTQKKAKPDKKAPVVKKKKQLDAEKRDLAKEREAIKEQQRLEKQRRLEEAKELQQKISLKEETRKAKEAEAKRKAEELAERMESIRMEEEEIERAEADARAQLAAVRKAQREEREERRKADLERKKQDAIEKREKEKAMMDAAREKEQEMLDRIADAEMARRLREEEEAKREEEEMQAQERFEAEMKAAQRAAEEEEEKLRELERQAEEEAFQRLLDEKEEAEERRWKLEAEARRMREEEEKMRQEMLEEERRLEEEKRKKEEEEEARREQERERLRELQRLEEEARDKMRHELDKRRTWALHRREYNLNARANLDAMRQSQSVTDPWTFSYFVRWPKESYMRPMGQDPKKQKGFKPKPKPPPQPPSNPNANAPPAVDVAAVPS